MVWYEIMILDHSLLCCEFVEAFTSAVDYCV